MLPLLVLSGNNSFTTLLLEKKLAKENGFLKILWNCF